MGRVQKKGFSVIGQLLSIRLIQNLGASPVRNARNFVKRWRRFGVHQNTILRNISFTSSVGQKWIAQYYRTSCALSVHSKNASRHLLVTSKICTQHWYSWRAFTAQAHLIRRQMSYFTCLPQIDAMPKKPLNTFKGTIRADEAAETDFLRRPRSSKVPWWGRHPVLRFRNLYSTLRYTMYINYMQYFVFPVHFL